MKKYSFLIVMVVLFGIISVEQACKKDDYKGLDCGAVSASYSRDIKPLIEANCLNSGCHTTRSSNGDFTEYKGLKGKANNGSLNKRVLETKDMPPGATLSLSDRKKIKCWLNTGAPEN